MLMAGRGTLMALALGLVFGGGWLAALVQSSAGRVDIHDLRFEGHSGATMSALLYVPQSATVDRPAPGVLAIHGYINSRETQSAYAIELARRGYVVLALDQRGHGYSAPPAFADGFGGVDGLRHLRSLEVVDNNQIVLSGHSMGGWAALIAAAELPDAYRSIIVSGSSTGTFGAPEGSASFPRNFALVFGRYDEFASTMWSVPAAPGIVDTEKLQRLFGTREAVVVDRLYGEIEAGTARKLHMPAQTHPANHITAAGVAPVINWIQATTTAPHPLPADDQVWQWKELGTLSALLGAMLLLFVVGDLLLSMPPFRSLRARPAPAAGIEGAGWWVAAGLFMAIPALTLLPLQSAGAAWLPVTALWSQNLTNGIMLWALGNALISLLLLLAWLRLTARGRRAGAASLGLARSAAAPTAARVSAFMHTMPVLLGLGTVASAGALVALSGWLFTTDFRWWVVAAKPLDGLRSLIFLGYLLPFTLFFVMAGTVLHGQLRGSGPARAGSAEMIRNALLASLGIGLLLLVQYGTLYARGTLAFAGASTPLLTILAIQFALLLPVTGMLSTYFFNRTGQVYVGAVVNGALVTWLIVGSQAIHHPF
jgi:pimeloyl-ACP methyl ester carboxylesterase